MKKIIALLMALMCLTLCSCGDGERSEKQEEKEENQVTQSQKQEEKEEEIETIYAKTPEEAAQMCLDAFKSGNLYNARHYVVPNSETFAELKEFRENMLKSFGVEGNEKLTQKAENLVNKVLGSFVYTKTDTKIDGDNATVTYSVTMPDMESIDYSKHLDAYMTAKGFTQESMIESLEGKTEAEIEEWSMEMGLDVMLYIFEKGTGFGTTNATTVVTAKKSKSGWLVSTIVNQ